MEKTLEPFSFTLGQLQDIITLITHLEANNIPFSEFADYVDKKKIERGKEVKKFKACELCKRPMMAEPVNNSPRTMTGDDSKMVYTCTNRGCMHQIFE